jgi:hypothetical protein
MALSIFTALSRLVLRSLAARLRAASSWHAERRHAIAVSAIPGAAWQVSTNACLR